MDLEEHGPEVREMMVVLGKKAGQKSGGTDVPWGFSGFEA